MPWEKATFEQDKRFMRRVIKGAENKTGWEKLDYSPNEQFVSCYLEKFENLINRMTADDIGPMHRRTGYPGRTKKIRSAAVFQDAKSMVYF